MRVVPLTFLQPGMVLGKNLYSENNELLLSKGQVLSEMSIKRLGKLNYHQVCIKDRLELEQENEAVAKAEECISETLRNSAVKAIKGLFHEGQVQGSISDETVYQMKDVVAQMVEEITANPGATTNMTDLKLYDDYTYYHSVNVTVISIVLGMALGFGQKKLYALGLGALLHDIGKILIPKEVLEKKEKLTDEEYSLLKTHSLNGYDYIKGKWDIPIESTLAVLAHHEQFSGAGYPNQQKGEDIPLFGRVVAVADVFDALTSDRPYRKAMSPSEGMEYILGNCGVHFDPTVVNAFLEKISPYPVGTHVQLSNGEVGIVVENRPNNGLRPKIRLLNNLEKPVYYDLCNDRNLLNIAITGISYQ